MGRSKSSSAITTVKLMEGSFLASPLLSFWMTMPSKMIPKRKRESCSLQQKILEPLFRSPQRRTLNTLRWHGVWGMFGGAVCRGFTSPWQKIWILLFDYDYTQEFFKRTIPCQFKNQTPQAGQLRWKGREGYHAYQAYHDLEEYVRCEWRNGLLDVEGSFTMSSGLRISRNL